MRLGELLPAHYDRVFAYNIDKRFSLLIKFVDYLIEPLFRGMGYDFYRDGYSRRYANMVNSDLAALDGGKIYNEVITRWNRFARNPTRDELASLKAFATERTESIKTTLSAFFQTVEKGIDFLIVDDERLENFDGTNEIQVTGMFQSVAYWREHRDENFRIVHDESKAFLKQRDLWSTMLRNDIDPVGIASAAGKTAVFPLRVVNTTSEQSERSASIQLCDVLAGVINRSARTLTHGPDPFVFDLMRTGFGEMPMSGVMPQKERVTDLPPRREGPDVLDQMVEVLQPHIDRKLREQGASDT